MNGDASMTIWVTAGSALLLTLLASLLNALLASFTLAGEAGVRRLSERYPRVEHRIARWENRWDVLVSALLIYSMMAQISAIVMAWLALTSLDVSMGQRIAIGMVVFFGLILMMYTLPRATSESFADKLSAQFLPYVSLASIPLFVFAKPLALIEKRIFSAIMSESDEDDHPTAEDEIRSVVNHAGDQHLEEHEREIISSVFELEDTVSREIMTPRVDIEGLPDTATVRECIDLVKASSHSRFPVYHDRMDNIRGIVHVKDLLRLNSENQADRPIRELVNEATFVPESMPISDLLKLMRTERSHLAVIVDEYGGTAGLVTMEDIIEELIGEIHDEYDIAELKFRRLSDGSAVLDASVPVDEVNERLNLTIPTDEDYDTIGGYVYHELGRIPRAGEMVEGRDFTITIQTADKRRVQAIRISKLTQTQPN